MGTKSQGEPVLLNHAFTNETSDGPFTIYDANHVVRTLLPNERLIIDSAQGTYIAINGMGGSWLTVYIAPSQPGNYLFVFAFTADSVGNSVGSATWSSGGGPGISLPPGVVPILNATDTGNIWNVTMTGRIVAATPKGRMPWQSKPA